jgi:hypothetical protein
MNRKGFGRKQSSLNRDITPVFAWKDFWGGGGLDLSGVAADIRTEHLPNASLECYRYANQFGTRNSMSSSLTMQTVDSSETVAPICQTARCHIRKYTNIGSDILQDLKAV